MKRPTEAAIKKRLKAWDEAKRRGDVVNLAKLAGVDVRTIRRAMKGEAVDYKTLATINDYFVGRVPKTFLK